MTTKTILHLSETSGPGGAEKVLISLVDSLDKKRYRSLICLLEDGWLNSELRQRGFETFIVPQHRSVDVVWLLRFMRLLKREKVDLMHAHEFAMNTYGCMVSVVTGVPIIATVHGKNYYWEKRRRRQAYRFVAKHSFRMVSVSEDLRHFLIERVGIEPGRLATIYNGIDLKAYPHSEERSQIRRELGIPETTPVIGTIGNLYPVKGHTYLLKAAAKVCRIFPEAIFLIVGRGELLSGLQEEIGQLGIEENVRLLGFRQDVSTLLQVMDLFVLPSLSEGLSISLLEAMAAGKPVVASNVGGNPEVVKDGETGFLVPPKDPESLAAKMILLLKNQPFARQLGKNGQQSVRARFSLENMVNSYERLYEEVLSGC